MSQFTKCPRCGWKTFEHLNTYSHCVDCFHVEDRYVEPDEVLMQAKAAEDFLESLEALEAQNIQSDSDSNSEKVAS